MTDAPENVEELARQTCRMAQRVAMRIAMPAEKRAVALATAKGSPTKTYAEFSSQGEQIQKFVDLQVKAIKHFVTEIEVTGNLQGGNA